MTTARRWAGLDGLRAVAIVAVLGTHFGFLGAGAIGGVDLFFVISGFLITSLLLQEWDANGSVSLRRFWARRGLRLLPALTCGVAFALLVSLDAAPTTRHETISGLPWVLLYVGNWMKAVGDSHTLGLMVHSWSLALEEQFYLLWPLIASVWVCRVTRRHWAAWAVSAMAFLDAMYLMWAIDHWDYRVFFRSDTHAMGLLAGCALALFINNRKAVATLTVPSLRRLRVGSAAAVVLFCVLCTSLPYSAFEATMASVVLVAAVVLDPAGRLSILCDRPLPRWLGRRSYGIYLYHFPLAVVFVQSTRFHGLAHSAVVLTCVAASIVLAAASYRWVELPFLRLKGRFNAITPDPEGVVPVTPQGVVGAPLPVR